MTTNQQPGSEQGDLFAEQSTPSSSISRTPADPSDSPAPADPSVAPVDNSSIGPLPMVMGLASPPLTRMTLPYKDTGERTRETRNGNQVLRITALGTRGLPFGIYPRLLLLWLTEQARDQARIYGEDDPRRYTVDLGNSEHWFVSQLGISLGSNTFNQVKEQMIRLATTSFHLSEEGELDDGDTEYVMVKNIAAAENMELYWSKQGKRIKKGPDTLLPSYIQLSKPFFELLTQGPFPYNKEILNHISRSPMAIDVYLWLTQCLASMHYSKRPVLTLRMDDFMKQLGTSYDPSDSAARRNFRTNLNKALDRIREVWPSIRIDVSPNVLVIHRTPPSVPMQHRKPPREIT